MKRRRGPSSVVFGSAAGPVSLPSPARHPSIRDPVGNQTTLVRGGDCRTPPRGAPERPARAKPGDKAGAGAGRLLDLLRSRGVVVRPPVPVVAVLIRIK